VITDKPKRFAFDLETTDPMWKGTFQAHHAEIIGYSIAIEEGVAYYTTDSIEYIREWLEDEEVEVVCHNSKFRVGSVSEIWN